MQISLRSKKGMVIAGVFAVGCVVLQVSGTPAKPQGRPAPRGVLPAASALPQVISPKSPRPLTLWKTFLDTGSGSIEPVASCDTKGCKAFSPMFEEEITCPGEVGGSCTFQISIESENFVASNDSKSGESGQYRFTVDGAAPSPGPVGVFSYFCPNCYEWMYSEAYYAQYVGTSYAVTADVTNTSYWEKHLVEVEIGCEEQNDDTSGCSAGYTLANLKVAVYTPGAEPY